MKDWIRGTVVYTVDGENVKPWGKILFLVNRDHVMIEMFKEDGTLSGFSRTMNVCDLFEYSRDGNRFIKVSEIKEGAWEP